MHVVNSSPVSWGIASLISALGSRFVVSSLTPAQEHFLAHPFTRRIVICCMIFVVTRDIIQSIMMTFGVILVLDVFTNETSRFCMIPLPRPLKHLRTIANSMGEEEDQHQHQPRNRSE